MKNIFTSIYQNCTWGNNANANYRGSSGDGSTLDYNMEYIKFVRDFIHQNDIKSIVDLGCGDWRLGGAIMNGLNSIEYTGYDIYDDLVNHLIHTHSSENIKFVNLDFSAEKEKIVSADLLICKDVLQHWSDTFISDFMEWLVNSQKFKFALITNSRQHSHTDNQTFGQIGGWQGLDSNHIFMKGGSTVLQYNTKDTLLFSLIK